MSSAPSPRTLVKAPAPSAGDLAPPDWPAIKILWETGTTPILHIAKEYGVSRALVYKQADRDNWKPRGSLKGSVRKHADELLILDEVTESGRRPGLVAEQMSGDQFERVLAHSAEALAILQLRQRADIRKARELVRMLMAELEVAMAQPDLAGRIHLALDTSDGERSWQLLTDLAKFITSLPERARTMRILAESLQRVVVLERIVWGLSSEIDGSGGDLPMANIKDFTGVGDPDAPPKDED